MQPNDVGTQRDLVLYRIEAAKEDLKSAKILRDADSYKGANNRAYYAIFHAINAVHGLRGVAYKRHKDAIGISIVINIWMIFCNSMLCKGSLPDKVVGFFCWFNGREWTILDKLAKNVLTFCGTKSIINL